MTVEVRVWYYFVAVRLMLVNANSEVLKKCALLTNAIMTNKTVDVGLVINKKFYSIIALRILKDSVGFSVIITSLCQKGKVQFTATSSKDEVPLKPSIFRSFFCDFVHS